MRWDSPGREKAGLPSAPPESSLEALGGKGQRKTGLDSQVGRHGIWKKGTRREQIPARGRCGSQSEGSFKTARGKGLSLVQGAQSLLLKRGKHLRSLTCLSVP